MKVIVKNGRKQNLLGYNHFISCPLLGKSEDFLQFAPTLKKLILFCIFFIMVAQAVRLFDTALFETKISKSITDNDPQDEKETKEDKTEKSELSICSFYSFYWAKGTVCGVLVYSLYTTSLHISPCINRLEPPPDFVV